ncbi:MAG: peptide chain release factor N(5)-glutamine methyltransferase [Bacilli bacterium]|nr:peptide chain release factor N(5)-glutamine methyltransferase [Bacilli bacterium]
MKLIDYIKEKENEASLKGLEAEAIKKLLLEGIYHSYTNLIMNYNNEIDSHYFNIMEELTSKYIDEKLPIQYILGYAYFRGIKLIVNNKVLIPRPETELLVDIAVKEIKENNYQKVLDIGTGSGAIAITIKNETNVSMYASDISSEALEVARENAKSLNQDITFINSDMFTNIEGTFDVIVSNPPYIDKSDINNIDEIVYRNEPHIALFSEEEGLYYYKVIIDNLDKYLNNNGVVIMEIGYNQGEKIKDYIINKKYNYDLTVIKDYNNLDRIVVLKRKM